MPDTHYPTTPDKRRIKQARFRKVFVRMWSQPTFTKLSEHAKLVALYILTGPQGNRIGYHRYTVSHTVEDTVLDAPSVISALSEIISAFDWKYDSDAKVLLIPTWFKWNTCDNEKHLKGCLNDLAEVPHSTLLSEFIASAKACVGEALGTVLDTEAIRYRGGMPYGMPYQEKEKEKEKGDKKEAPPENPAGAATPKKRRGRPVSEPDPRVPVFLKWFASEYESTEKVPYVVQWESDAAIVKHLLKALPSERELRERAWTLFHLSDDWSDQMGRSIKTLKSRINWLGEAKKRALAAWPAVEFDDAMLGYTPDENPPQVPPEVTSEPF